MKKTTLNHYLTLGSSIRFLLDITEGTPIHKPLGHNELSLIKHFERIFEFLPEMGFVTGHLAIIDQLGGVKAKLEATPKEEKLSATWAREINSRTRIVANILQYESGTLSVYLVSEKR